MFFVATLGEGAVIPCAAFAGAGVSTIAGAGSSKNGDICTTLEGALCLFQWA